MNKVNRFRAILVNKLTVLVYCLLFISFVYSENVVAVVSPDQLTDDRSVVMELMRLETAQALHQSREHIPSDHNTAPVLKALYGVGRNVTAEIKMGSQILKYISGNKVPLGISEKNAPFLLISINGICVTLSDKIEPYELCLSTR